MSARPKIEAYKLRKHLHDDLPRGHGPVKPGSVLAAVIEGRSVEVVAEMEKKMGIR